jgi:hypothetical protein
MALGKNLHAIADNDSPSHQDFQPWLPYEQLLPNVALPPNLAAAVWVAQIAAGTSEHMELEREITTIKFIDVKTKLRNEYDKYFAIFASWGSSRILGIGSGSVEFPTGLPMSF